MSAQIDLSRRTCPELIGFGCYLPEVLSCLAGSRTQVQPSDTAGVKCGLEPPSPGEGVSSTAAGEGAVQGTSGMVCPSQGMARTAWLTIGRHRPEYEAPSARSLGSDTGAPLPPQLLENEDVRGGHPPWLGDQRVPSPCGGPGSASVSAQPDARRELADARTGMPRLYPRPPPSRRDGPRHPRGTP